MRLLPDRLRGFGVPLVLFLAALSGGASLLFFTSDVLDNERRKTQALEMQREQLLARLDHLRETQRVYRLHGAAYRAFRERGVFTREQRVIWVETLERIGERLRLESLSYRIGARRPLEADSPAGSSGLGRYRTAMNISADLYHEGDLLRMEQILAASRSGLFELSSCDIRRSQGAEPGAPLLRADCVIDWLTLVFDDASSGEDEEGPL